MRINGPEHISQGELREFVRQVQELAYKDKSRGWDPHKPHHGDNFTDKILDMLVSFGLNPTSDEDQDADKPTAQEEIQ